MYEGCWEFPQVVNTKESRLYKTAQHSWRVFCSKLGNAIVRYLVALQKNSYKNALL